MNSSSKRVVLFDMDGVLVQTEPLKAKAHALTVQAFGGSVEVPLYQQYMGQSHSHVRAAFIQAAGISIDRDHYTQTFRQIYHELLNRELKVTSGIPELLKELKGAAFCLGVVSSSVSLTMMRILTQTSLIHYFATCISGDDVTKQKPAPDAYLLALQKLKSTPAEAVIFEDSEVGVKAGILANIPVIAVRHAYNSKHDFSHAYRVIDSFMDFKRIKQLIINAR